MIIELIHDDSGETVTITTSVDDRDTKTQPTYVGDHDLLAELEADLKQQTGIYGHIFDPANTTNLDLYSAVQELSNFSVSSIEGEPPAAEDLETEDNQS